MPNTATPARQAAAPLGTVQQPGPGTILPLRRFRVDYDADGAPFVWEGEAVSEQAAIRCAAHDLAVYCPNFDGVIRATSVIEVG